jgi:hypothetical protein
VKRPTAHSPQISGLYELDRLADEAVDLAAQIQKQVRVLREQDDDAGETERDTTD